MTLRRTLVASLAVFAIAVPVARADTTTTIGFDDLPAGTAVTDQYAPSLLFANPRSYGFTQGATYGDGQYPTSVCGTSGVLVAAAGNTSSPPNAVALNRCGQEIPAMNEFMVLPTWRRTVTVLMGDSDGSASKGRIEIAAWDYTRHFLGTAFVDTPQGGVRTPLTISSPLNRNEIAFVLVIDDAPDAAIALDDVSFNVSATPPPPQFSLAAPVTALRVREGAETSLDVAIARWNGSAGRVQLATPFVPAGIDAQAFTPSVTAGTTSTWSLHAADAGPPGGFPVTISAVPVDAGAGSVGSDLAIPVDVVANFSLAAPTSLNLPPCTPTAIPSGLQVEPGFTQPVQLTATHGDSLTVSPENATYTPGFGDPPTFTVTGNETSLVKVPQLTISAASPPYPAWPAVISFTKIAGTIDEVDIAPETVSGRHLPPGNLELPEWGHSGTRLEIHGTGFCHGVSVSFGNTASATLPYTYSADGRTLEVEVPHLAVSGPIMIGTPYGMITSTASYTVTGHFRQEVGFSFANDQPGPSIGFDDLVEAYGYDQTHVDVDPCSWLTLGLGNCSLAVTPVPSPGALALADYYHFRLQAGLCWGFLKTAYDVFTGKLAPASVDAGATSIQTVRRTGDSVHVIAIHHLLQFSTEVQLARKAASLAAGQAARAGDSAARLRDALLADLYQGRPTMVEMYSGGSGHVVMAYDVRDTGGGSYDIETYNPNVSWTASETDPDPSTDHATNEGNSVVHVSANGSWSFPELRWVGDGTSIFSLPYSAVPDHPTLPTSIADAIIVSSAGTPIAQVLDPADRPMISVTGAGLRGATVLPPTDSHDDAGPELLLPKSPGLYTVELAQGGPTSLLLTTRGFTATIAAGARSGAAREVHRIVGVNAGNGQLTLPNALGGTVRATLEVAATDGSTHTAAVTVQGTGDALLRLAPGSGTLALDQSDGAASVQLSLGRVGHASLPTSYLAQPVRLAAGDRLTIAGSAWQGLGAGLIATVRHADGSSSRIDLRSLRTATGRITMLRTKATKHGHSVVLAIRARTTPGLAGQATIVWAIVRGKRVVRAKKSSMSARALSAATSTWNPGRLRHGRYRLIVGLVVTRGGAVESVITRKASRSFTT